MRTYQAHAVRNGRSWLVSVPEVDGLAPARSLAEAGEVARNLVALTLDSDLGAFDVNITVRTVGRVDDVSGEVAAVRRLRNRAARRETEAGRREAALTKELRAEGLTARDIDAVLDVASPLAHRSVNARPQPGRRGLQRTGRRVGSGTQNVSRQRQRDLAALAAIGIVAADLEGVEDTVMSDFARWTRPVTNRGFVIGACSVRSPSPDGFSSPPLPTLVE